MRLGARVDVVVPIQVALCHKALAALGADVGPLARVGPLVGPQGAPQGEALPAGGAHVWPPMHSLAMLVQEVPRGEDAGAVQAREGLHSGQDGRCLLLVQVV
uniref:Uncharacterized protein n=1 Tax=Ixodes ricinus TaxID=34613 RepID=A0A6B0UFB2_IXORI